jgi:8-oxo-dGTP pyrophosphatase MutT (NUDIX family)
MYVNARAIIEKEADGESMIVVQIRNKPHEGGKWLELPGGRVEEFESLVSALRREVMEEAGLEITHVEGLSLKVPLIRWAFIFCAGRRGSCSLLAMIRKIFNGCQSSRLRNG